MTVLRTADLRFAYGGQSDLFEGISFHLTNGWTGLVGPNGAGKSTLLGLLAGDLRASSGIVHTEPAHARVARCSQRVDCAAEHVEEFATCWTGEAMRWMSLLELGPEEFYRWDRLSPGQRKRWQIGATLYAQPEIALLDEPTNHLDRAGRDLLARALEQFDGVGLMVSHDRTFLDRLCNEILWLEAGQLESYDGGFSQARTARREKIQRQRARVASLQRDKRKLESQHAERRRRANEAEAAISTRTRSSGINDSDARSTARKGRAARATTSHSKAAGAAGSRLSRIASQLDDLSYVKGPSGSLDLGETRLRKKTLCRVRTSRVAYGDTIVFAELDVSVEHGERIWLDAPNGSGKTTLIRQIIDHWALDDQTLLYLPQELRLGEAKRLLEATKALPNDTLGEVMQRVAALGVEPDALLGAVQPSPGEARKLMLARGLTHECALVIFDEPTNHLDIQSIERLETVLADYAGAILLVSHDEAFARAVTNERWRIRQRRVERT